MNAPVSLRVLLVEDSEDDALLLARALRRAGYDLSYTRVDTPEGMQAALAEQTWDLVISDYSMPKFDGLAALEMVRDYDPDMPFIIVSGTIGEDAAVAAMRAGAHDYLMKGDLARMIPAVQRELQEAEVRRAARRSEEQIRKLSRAIEHSPVSVIITDTQGQIEYVNPKFTQFTGYTPEEALGRNPRILKSGETPPEVYHELWETVLSGEEWRGELRNRKKNGDLYWELATISAIRNTEGEISHFVKLGEDITERKQAEEMLKRYNRELNTLYEIGHDISETLDLLTVLTRIATHARDLLEADTSEVYLVQSDDETLRAVVALGDNADEVKAEPISLEASVIGDVVSSGEGALAETPQSQPDAKSQSLVCVPLVSRGRVIGVMALRRTLSQGSFTQADLEFLISLAPQAAIAIENARLYSMEHQRAAELAVALEQQQELDRLKDEFIQNVSHELRTPLAIARGYAELLEDGTLGELSPKQSEPVGIIVRRLRMLTQLVSDINVILDVQNQEAERLPVDLATLTSSMIGDFHIAAEQAGLTLEAQVASDLPLVTGDRTQLHRVLDNLLGNALKFTPAGGRIAVSLQQEGDNVVLQVTDTGIGIPLDKQARIFERFYQVDGSMTRQYGGTGLGLALVKEIVEAHNGSVDVESQPGMGSTFTVRLPARK